MEVLFDIQPEPPAEVIVFLEAFLRPDHTCSAACSTTAGRLRRGCGHQGQYQIRQPERRAQPLKRLRCRLAFLSDVSEALINLPRSLARRGSFWLVFFDGRGPLLHRKPAAQDAVHGQPTNSTTRARALRAASSLAARAWRFSSALTQAMVRWMLRRQVPSSCTRSSAARSIASPRRAGSPYVLASPRLRLPEQLNRLLAQD